MARSLCFTVVVTLCLAVACGSVRQPATPTAIAPRTGPATPAATQVATPSIVRSVVTPSPGVPAITVVALPGTPGQIVLNRTGPLPAAISIQAGRRVTFVNNDTVAHHPVSDEAGLFDAGEIQPGASASVALSAVGSHPWHDAHDSSVRGLVAVLP
jgi:hypothetical protein